MKTTSRLLALFCALAAFASNGARGFSISAVTLSPGNIVEPATELRMTIDIVTPSAGTWLYAPTEVSSNANNLRVDVYPTSGPLTVISSLRETVTLGVFPIGTYNYEVVIHPDFEVNWGTRTNRGSFTVQASPPLPEVYIRATVPETLEPSANTRVAPGEFTITRLGDTNEPLNLFVEFTGTATFGQDYQEVPRYVVMQAGETKLNVLVGPLDDSMVEGDETVIATLSTNPPINSLPNYTVHWRLNSATVVIHDNDFPDDLPVVSISGISQVLESCPPNADCVGISFTLRRTGPGLDRPLTAFVRYRGTASADIDYPALPGLVTFEAGRDVATVSGAPIDDTLYEGDETITAEVIPQVDYRVDPNRWQATTIIRDNDRPAPPVVSLELVQREAMETRMDQNAIIWAEFRVLRTGPVTNELMVFLNTRQGTARLGEDYRLERVSDGSAVRFLPGERFVNVRLYPIDDDFYEGDETVFFHLVAPPAGSHPYDIDVDHSSVSMVIHDNDPVATRLEITAPRDGQHFEAGDVIELRAQIIGPGTSNLWSVQFFDGNQHIATTQPGGAIGWQDASGGPHVVNALATNPVGESLAARPVTIAVGPGPAWPVVTIGAGRGQTLEPCPVCFSVPAVFTVSRTGPTDEALTVYLEYDGPATPGGDYQALPHQIRIPPGTNTAHILVVALDDQLVEGPEIVRASIALPELATLGYIASRYASKSMVVINDDEPGAPEARLDIVEPLEGAQLAPGMPISVSALGVWTQGEVDRPVGFFAGDLLIGRSDPPQLGRPTIPGLPSMHTILWTNPPPGQHILNARNELSLNLSVTSPPVRITVGPEPPRTIVRIEATSPIAEEDSLPFDRLNLVGVFTISRSGPANDPLPVYVQYAGSATAERDYPTLPWVVTVPAGATSTQIRVEPVADGVPEGIETLVATISNCPPPWLRPPCYNFETDPAHASATVFLRDDGITQASLAITNPKDGATFNIAETILIEATAIDLEGYISRVEFFDGDRRIGESEIVFIRAPDPGTPIQHSFEWRGADDGSHVLTAGATDANGVVLMSPPVRITVRPGSTQPPAVAITRPTQGAAFPPDTSIEIVAETRDPDGYVRKMEFFADRRKIGESSVEFIRPPDPGQPQSFTFVWSRPEPGPHSLTARATDDGGNSTTSAPVSIAVAMSEPLPIVTVIARDAWAVEPASNSSPNTATFRIRRFGPTNDALLVTYSLRGTAENGIDYDQSPAIATIPAGRRSVLVTITPLADNLREGRETVVLRLHEPPPSNPEQRVVNGYRIGWPGVAVALISDPPSPPVGPRCVVLPEHFLHVCFAAENGHNFRLETTSDLHNWETLCDTWSGDGAWHFIDPEMDNQAQRFYRLTPEPVAEADE